MGVGDEILAAGQAQRQFDSTGRPSMIFDRNGKPRWHPIWDDNPAILHPDDFRYADPFAYYHLLSAPNARPYIVYPFTAESGWTFNRTFRARDHVARIYLTDAEKQHGQLARVGGSFILIEPYSKHANLRWPRDHWTPLVAMLLFKGYRILQHVHSATDYIVTGAEAVPTATFRDACGVLNAASLYIRGESGMCHAAAALGVPQVTIWGECMDWDVLGGYPKQLGVGVSANAPCGSYLPCTHCAETMAAIDPTRVYAAALHQLEAYGVR